MMTFQTQLPVLFRHCDVAGIVFYPRYVEMVNEIIEQWFAEALAVPFRKLHLERGLGIPTVRLEVDYRAPSTLGDVIDFALVATEIRTRAFSVRIVGKVGETECLVSNSTLVFVKSGNSFKGEGAMKSTPIPDDIRARMEAYLDAAAPRQEPVNQAGAS